MTEFLSADANKAVYNQYHDEIVAKRFHAQSPIRRHAHRAQYQAIVDVVPAGSTVLDAGCGEGVLSVLLAQKGCIVTGIDLSAPNVEASQRLAAESHLEQQTTFLVGDVETLPFADRSFDVVVSSHVLEHLPDFEKGARELRRVAKTSVVIAIPTCLNPCAMVLLGGDKYWTFSRRTPYAFVWGFLQVLWAFITGQDGVNEGYAGRKDLVHIWRFPWRGKRSFTRAGLTVTAYRASSFVMPYLSLFVPISKALLPFASWPLLKNCGYGTTYICRP